MADQPGDRGNRGPDRSWGQLTDNKKLAVKQQRTNNGEPITEDKLKASRHDLCGRLIMRMCAGLRYDAGRWLFLLIGQCRFWPVDVIAEIAFPYIQVIDRNADYLIPDLSGRSHDGHDTSGRIEQKRLSHR